MSTLVAVAIAQHMKGPPISESEAEHIAIEWLEDQGGVAESDLTARAILTSEAWEVIVVVLPAKPDSYFHLRISRYGRVLAVGSGGSPVVSVENKCYEFLCWILRW
jgi:hypothetical protein